MNLIDSLIDIDKKLFLFINGLHDSHLDETMRIISTTGVWIPFYAVLIFLIIRKFKKQSWLPLLTITLLIVLCDQFASGLMKPLFERLRPCHEPSLQNLIYMPFGCGGQYGFISSHAANTFGLAMFIWLLFKKQSKYWGLMFLWAFIVSYSRIYLAAHYPADVFLGGLSGVLWAKLLYEIMHCIQIKKGLIQ